MALETSQKAKEITNALHHGDHIDDMTKKWLSLTPNPPQIPVFYTQEEGSKLHVEHTKDSLERSFRLQLTSSEKSGRQILLKKKAR